MPALEYSISTTDSDIFLDGVRTTDIENVNSFATLTAVRGSITVKSSSMQLIKMTAEEGNITVDASTGTVSSDFITYDIKATEGAINYNGTDYEGELKITSPDEKSKIFHLPSARELARRVLKVFSQWDTHRENEFL